MPECIHCGQELVKHRIFWVLPSEVDTGKATFCPGRPGHDLHEVDEDEEEYDDEPTE